MTPSCALYTVSIGGYDTPHKIAPNISCRASFIHDGMHTDAIIGAGWTPFRVTPYPYATNKVKCSQYKLRRHAQVAFVHTIYVDANVEIVRDPAPLVAMCRTSLCMFSLGRSVEWEINWLKNSGYASYRQAETLRRAYERVLHEPAWYSKVIVRRDDVGNVSARKCFESKWFDAINCSNAVHRDQVHINKALESCGESIQDLREQSHGLAMMDPRFRQFFRNTGSHAKPREKGRRS